MKKVCGICKYWNFKEDEIGICENEDYVYRITRNQLYACDLFEVHPSLLD